MIFPIGLFLSVFLAICISMHWFDSFLNSIKVEKNTFLLFCLLYIVLMLFDLTIPYIEYGIVLNLAFLLTLLIALKCFDRKLDFRVVISCSVVCGMHIFINFAPYISNYFIIMISSYILPFFAVITLFFFGNDFKKGIGAIAFGYIFSEMIMLFFRAHDNLIIGNITGQNIFLMMAAFYCFLFPAKCRILRQRQNDIC